MTITSGTDAKALQPADKRYEVPCEDAPHLYVVVQPTGSKSWCWRARPKGGGNMIKLTLGKLETHSYAEAVVWAQGENKKRDAGHNEKEARAEGARIKAAKAKADAEREAKTMDWYWREHYSPRFVEGTRSEADMVRMWKAYIQPAIAFKPISDVEHDDLSAIVMKVYETAPVVANRVATFLGTLFRRALTDFRTQSGLKTNPAEYLVKPYRKEKERRVQRVLDRAELGYALSVIDEVSTASAGYLAVYARGLRLCILTGCRIQEALDAPWAEFDLEQGQWNLPAERSKNKLPMLYPLPPKAVAWLKERHRATNSDYVFSVDGEKPINGTSKPQSFMSAAVAELAKRDGREVERWAAHALRRTFSSHLNSLRHADDLTAMVPPWVVEALLNHISGSKAGVAGTYNKWDYAPEKKAALIKWEGYLETVLSEQQARERAWKAAQAAEPMALAA